MNGKVHAHVSNGQRTLYNYEETRQSIERQLGLMTYRYQARIQRKLSLLQRILLKLKNKTL